MGWLDYKEERDENGKLTLLALALTAIGSNGCDCGTDEKGDCLACRCEAALHEQLDAIACLRGNVDKSLQWVDRERQERVEAQQELEKERTLLTNANEMIEAANAQIDDLRGRLKEAGGVLRIAQAERDRFEERLEAARYETAECYDEIAAWRSRYDRAVRERNQARDSIREVRYAYQRTIANK